MASYIICMHVVLFHKYTYLFQSSWLYLLSSTFFGPSTSYNKLCGLIKQLVAKLKASLGPEDPFRIAMTDELLDKLHRMGLINTTKSLQKAEEISASAFCRRRIPVVMVRMKMAQNLKVAVTLVEQGQVRVGVNVITDPAFMVTRSMEDFLTWVDSSKIKRTVQRYNDKLDDFDLL
jgi:U3 small nucleolar ribonucleoprotein protein IMP3